MNKAKRYDRLVEVKEVKLDGHVHVFSNPRPRANSWCPILEGKGMWPFPRDPGSRKLVDFVINVGDAGINSVALTNAGDDWLYERFTIQARELPAGYGFYQDDRITQVLNKEGKPYTFIKAEELFTKQGHMLVWGTKFGQMYQPKAGLREFKEKVMREFHVDDALEEVEKDELLTIISDHPDYDGGLGTGLGTQEAKARGRASLDKEEIRKRIHAYEWNALVPKKANKKTLARAKRDKKPVVYGSDSHRLSQIGAAHNIFNGNDLSWSNGEDFVASLRENVENARFRGYGKQLPFSAWLHHAYMFFVDHKLGLYTKDVETDDFDIEKTKRLLEQV